MTSEERIDLFAAMAPPVPDWYAVAPSVRPPRPKAEPVAEAIADVLADGRWDDDGGAGLITVRDGRTMGWTLADVDDGRRHHADLDRWVAECKALNLADDMRRLATWPWAYAKAVLVKDGIGPPESPDVAISTPGLELVKTERLRQIMELGFDAANDAREPRNAHAEAALSYLAYAVWTTAMPSSEPPQYWPWHHRWWKPRDRLRTLVKAAALAVAAVDREFRAVNGDGVSHG